MAEFPALPLFTDAYFGDTRHLTCLEHGAYLQLLMVAWRDRDCRLRDDDALLARYTGLTKAQWTRIAPTIRAFFETEEGFLIQRRLRDEFDHVRQVRQSQAANGRASALKRKGRHSAKRPKRLNGASTPTPTPTPTPTEDSPDGESTPFPPQPQFKAWIEMRRKIGKAPTDFAVKLALGKLERLRDQGFDPSEVLDQSTLNSWPGLYPVREDRTASGRLRRGWRDA